MTSTITSELRGQGIGAAMLELLQSHAEASRIDAIEINVDEGDLDTQRFYERNGYSSIEPETDERAFYYFRELTPSRSSGRTFGCRATCGALFER